MELKFYQKLVIDDLVSYLECLDRTHNPSKAFEEHWRCKSVEVGTFPLQMQPYKETVQRCPQVCLKVPTAGGKTFIACNALQPIFDRFPVGQPKAVIWLVPSVTILEQTLKSLRNADHPYRQKINVHFNGRVEVYDKDQLLQGANFNSTTIKEQLSIFVLSFDSFRATNKEGRKIYQENGNLENFVKEYKQPESLIEGTDETALIQVINQLNPVCIVDESHNAETELSLEMLQNLNPSFILDLTATPRKNSNIISFVDAFQLKKEHMVKLPVIVYNHVEKEDVISDALQLQKNLEEKAKEEEKKTGKYIRPLVLFQAEPKSKDDTVTFEKIKENLIGIGIPREHIAIKTASINEIKNVELMDKNCPVRFIITVNALKEGWDCPFAYILASLANKSSAVDVEQILGRILRQPHVQEHQDKLLNLSYVFTASTAFQDTLESIVKGLNKSGFSKKDCRVIENNSEVEDSKVSKNEDKQELFEHYNANVQKTVLNDKGESAWEFDSSQVQVPTVKTGAIISQIEEQAMIENNEFEKTIEASKNSAFAEFAPELLGKMNTCPMKVVFRDDVQNIKIPQFFITVPCHDLFTDGDEKVLLNKEYLLNGIELSKCDTNINFEDTEDNFYKVDIEKGAETPTFARTKDNIKRYILEYASKLPEARQQDVYVEMIFQFTGRFDGIPEDDLKKYMKRVLDGMDAERFSELKNNVPKYARIIKKKIKELSYDYMSDNFYKLLDKEKIFANENYSFPEEIHPVKKVASIIKSLYEEEGDINDFEKRVIDAVANLDNVKFWHRNPANTGFFINGFLNQYPDFIVQTNKGKTIIIETKGDDRDNSDSREKLKLGQEWAHRSGDRFKYFMVFDHNPLDGAHSFSNFLDILRDL